MTLMLIAVITAVLIVCSPSRCSAAEAPQVHSPELHGDNSVTFRLYAPKAKEVTINLDLVGVFPMTKDANDVWSYTAAKLAADVYSYSMTVDGLNIADPTNPLTKSFVNGNRSSLLVVPSKPAASWDWSNVPHGVVHHHVYHSKAINDEREFYVYTPANFDASGKTKYPLLVLRHGLSDDASGWFTIGRANLILDNLIAQGKAVPMIVVAQLGYGMKNPNYSLDPMFKPETQLQCGEALEKSLMEEIVPEVTRTYHVANDRSKHAIAGLSMGGGQSLSIGFNHLDYYAYIASFSGAISMIDDQEATFEHLNELRHKPLKLFWIAIGKDDFLIEENRKFHEMLITKNIKHTYIETAGGHTWPNWRQYLTELAPQLFKK